MNAPTEPDTEELARLGMCASCAHQREIHSDRGSVFCQCGLAVTDPRFPQYPRLPVLSCGGYEPQTNPAEDTSPTNSV